MIKSNVWITSDTHFSHQKLIDDGIRPHDVDYLIIKNLQGLIRTGDTLIHLGDVTWSSCIDERFIALPCKKILVRGNHDKQTNSWYESKGFDFSCDSFSRVYNKKNILFTHRPFYSAGNSSFDYNIHGHLHDMNVNTCSQKNVFAFDNHEHHYLISLELNKYMPELLDKIISRIN